MRHTLLILVPFTLVQAQKESKPLLLDQVAEGGYIPDTATIRRIAELVSERELMSHLSFLASDAVQGREAGTPFEKVAATYLIAHHQRWGNPPFLKNSYVHAFPLRRIRPTTENPDNPKNSSKKKPVQTSKSLYDTLIAWNVLAYRPGTVQPGQYVILSAHYDHLGVNSRGEVYNGADDNGSGTAVLLEAARLLSLLPPPKRSIIFFHTGAEEKGLVGAFRFVRDSLIPLDSIVAVLNVDMLGRADTLHQPGENYLYAIGPAYTTPRLREIHEAVNAACCGWQFDYRYDDKSHPERLFYRSDHYAFAQKGVPAVFYFGGLHEDYHQTTDDIEKIEPARLRRSAVLLVALAWTLANM
jgi:hypothetical protein